MHPPIPAAPAQPCAEPEAPTRELLAAREIAHAFLTARAPEEVFSLALARVVPLLDASFASVYVLDAGGELMRLAAAHDWPERYAPWLGRVRVRLGSGPSGIAARERRTVEIPDIFAAEASAAADDALGEWQEVAREMGVRALVALPLATRNGVFGAVTFYYVDAAGFTAEQRALQQSVADQLAAVAEKARLIAELQVANESLVHANAELARRNAALEDARRVKDEFLTNISHELRTPLTAVLGYVSLLVEGFSGPLTETQHGSLRQVKHASERLVSLIDDLLELTTLKRGGLELRLDSFDPREPLREAVQAGPGPRDGVTFAVAEPSGDLPSMRSDRKKIVKALVSVLENAYKFTVGGDVRVSLALVNGEAVYRVRDTGIGIAPELQQAVFDEFRQADGSATRRYGGSGLGLSLARRLARLLGGDLELESEPDVGSTFTLRLPLDATAGQTGDTITTATHEPAEH